MKSDFSTVILIPWCKKLMIWRSGMKFLKAKGVREASTSRVTLVESLICLKFPVFKNLKNKNQNHLENVLYPLAWSHESICAAWQQRGSGGGNGKNWKHENAKAQSLCAGWKQSGRRRQCRIFFCYGKWLMPPPQEFCSGKGAWLSSRQTSAKMSGGLNKVGYEKLIHLVLQTESSMTQPI